MQLYNVNPTTVQYPWIVVLIFYGVVLVHMGLLYVEHALEHTFTSVVLHLHVKQQCIIVYGRYIYTTTVHKKSTEHLM